MSELDMLQKRQELLEQAARLQRATVVVRLHKLQENRGPLLVETGWQLVQRFFPLPGPMLMAWKTVSWLLRKKRAA